VRSCRKLLARGYRVRVLDLYLYGTEVLDSVRDDPRLEEVRGDIRDPECVAHAIAGVDAVIHLACISNDPSFEARPGPRPLDQLRRVHDARRPGA
jgi:nucleoside-diphosphate-sugar epimerase